MLKEKDAEIGGLKEQSDERESKFWVMTDFQLYA
jgi:hypothetical protein